jgi:hypothetical protein
MAPFRLGGAAYLLLLQRTIVRASTVSSRHETPICSIMSLTCEKIRFTKALDGWTRTTSRTLTATDPAFAFGEVAHPYFAFAGALVPLTVEQRGGRGRRRRRRGGGAPLVVGIALFLVVVLLLLIAVEHFNLFAILIVAIDILNAILKIKKK